MQQPERRTATVMVPITFRVVGRDQISVTVEARCGNRLISTYRIEAGP